MALEQTWRWFGPHDPVTLKEIRQAGATGIVTALHHIPTGEVWPMDQILLRKGQIEAEGLRWSVAESIPVHEDIKRRSRDYRKYIESYQRSLRHLGRCGIDTVCYNFMPVLDWSRTDLQVRFKDGSITTGFESRAFAAFDLCVLKRPDAEQSYPEPLVREARRYYDGLSQTQKDTLLRTVLLGFPGSGVAYTLEGFRNAVLQYREVGKSEFQGNLVSFVRDILPVAEEAGIMMALHPDDPPWSLLGLPRIVSTAVDLADILSASDSPSHGLTLCTGSLGASFANNVAGIAERFAPRVNFLHLRNVRRNTQGDFVEDDHLGGDVDMFAVMKTMILEQHRREQEGTRRRPIPFRPDHGRLMLADTLKAEVYPGYSLFGRMRALAELRGLEAGIRGSLGLPVGEPDHR